MRAGVDIGVVLLGKQEGKLEGELEVRLGVRWWSWSVAMLGLWLELRRTAAPTTERGRTREGVGERGQAIARMVGECGVSS